MNPFDYERAADAAGAVTTVTDRPDAVFLAGGTNLVDHLKLGVAEPDLVVDINRLELTEVEALDDGGLRIGAMVRNSDAAADPRIRRDYLMLSRALLSGASGQLRNAATMGGNLLQRTRCVYFQDTTTPCNKREPGSGCSAIGGYTRYHAILGASADCVATHPSDMAVALAALDATVVVLGATGERRTPVTELHRLPGDRPEQDTVLEHGELITALESLPRGPAPRRTGRSATAPPTPSLSSPSRPESTSTPQGERRSSVKPRSPSAESHTNPGVHAPPRRCCVARNRPPRRSWQQPTPSSRPPNPSRATASRSR